MSTRKTRRRGNREILAGVVGFLVAGMLAAWILEGVRAHSVSRDAFPLLSGRLQLESLQAPVTIDRDGRGIPHVAAENERDGWFGLGFVHAQDRLGQMLWLRVLAQGRSAEFMGEGGLDADRLARVLNFSQLGATQLENLRPDVLETLTAYAAGINARIARIDAREVGAPVVVSRLALPLDPWQPADSLAVLKLYAWSLGQSLDASLLLQDVMERTGATGARPFFPGGRATEPPTRQRAAIPHERSVLAASGLRALLGLHGSSFGSSAWVVGGLHTESGMPILMADAHLAATAPPFLHIDRLRAAGIDIAGATLPGVPVFWTGRNRYVTWASVSAPAVVTDLYTETVDDSEDSRYHDGNEWRPLEERIEILKVRGGSDVELRVRSTGHGPLLPAHISPPPLSLAWVGARVDGPSGIGSLLDVARAGNADAIVDAMESHHEPALLMVYADAAGAAGFKMAGWIPNRSLSAELMPLPGRARWYDWNERVPYKALPSARLVGGEGWLVAADVALDSSDPEYAIDWLWRSGHRSKRIHALLRDAVAKGPVGLRTLARLQRDVRDPQALSLVRDALALVTRDDAAQPLPRETLELIEILSRWDGRVTAESVGATAYHVFSMTLTDTVLEAQLGEALLQRYLALPLADPERVAQDLVHEAARAKGGARARWEPIAEAVRTSLREAWLRLSYDLGANRRRWNWGRLHPLRFRPFVSVPGAALRETGLAAIPYGGNSNTISAAAYDPSSSFEVRVASTLRFGVDVAWLDQGLVSLAPGQSEHPGHPHYADGLPGWRSGEGDLLASGQLLVEESSVARLNLEPVR